MTRIIAFLALSGLLGLADSVGAMGQTASGAPRAALAARAQAAANAPRPRTRIRVYPAYPYRLYSTTYPVPYPYEYPGPGAVRQCTSWLAPEYRASGTVIVPRERCWWER